jgi:hypothetical protein
MTRNERLAVPRLSFYDTQRHTRIELMAQLLAGKVEPEPTFSRRVADVVLRVRGLTGVAGRRAGQPA